MCCPACRHLAARRRRKRGQDTAGKQPAKAGGVSLYVVRLVTNKGVSSQVYSFNTHKSSQELGKPVMAAREGGAFLLHFSAFSMVISTTSGRSALLSVHFLPLGSSGWQ